MCVCVRGGSWWGAGSVSDIKQKKGAFDLSRFVVMGGLNHFFLRVDAEEFTL